MEDLMVVEEGMVWAEVVELAEVEDLMVVEGMVWVVKEMVWAGGLILGRVTWADVPSSGRVVTWVV